MAKPSGPRLRAALGRTPRGLGLVADLSAVGMLIFFGELRQIAAIAGFVGFTLGLYATLRQWGKPLSWYPSGVAVLTMIAGSVIGTTALIIPTSPNQGTPAIAIDSVRPGDKVVNPARLAGSVDAPLRPGETIWHFVSYGNLANGRPEAYQLLSGPCSTEYYSEKWTCPEHRLDVEDERPMTFHFISASPTQSQNFVRYLKDGAALDKFNNYCTRFDFYAEEGRSDPRSFKALPGGEGIVHLTEIPITLLP